MDFLQKFWRNIQNTFSPSCFMRKFKKIPVSTWPFKPIFLLIPARVYFQIFSITNLHQNVLNPAKKCNMQGVLLFALKAKINVFLNYFRGNRTSCNHSYTVVALFFHFQGNVQLPKMKCYYYFFRMSIGSPRGGFSKYIFKKFTQPPCDKQLICKTTSNPEKLFPN